MKHILKFLTHVTTSSMKRTRFLTCLVITIILVGAFIGCYKKFACYAIYEIHKDEWIEVYRSIDSERAHNKYWELRNNNPEKKVYIYVDEELGNSIIPF